MTMAATTHIDWTAVRDTIDLAQVVTRLLGPASGRRGERGRRLWWSCPLGTHEDRNPSFVVDPAKGQWHCYGCGEHGDAVALVKRLRNATFPEAVAFLTGGPAPRSTSKAATRPATRPVARPAFESPPEPSGLPEADALILVEASTARLWSPEGADALAYLTGPKRCLSPETIRAARLGWTPGVAVPTRDGDRSFRALGWVIPWFVGSRLVLVKIRQPDGCRPKYTEAFRDPARLVCYPGPATIRPGRPLIVTEGEFDALCLGEVLGELAAVVTLGSASARPDSAILGRMLSATPWFIATDADAAGDKAASDWPARTRRVRPPAYFKDWTEARQGGVNLRHWWGEVLSGVERPYLWTWDEVKSPDSLDVGCSDRGRLLEVLAAVDLNDPDAVAEREAIQAEARETEAAMMTQECNRTP
jgi:DNA primase